MTVEEARDVVARDWLQISEQALKCPARIDDMLTEEYDWGWSFYCGPVDPSLCPLAYKRRHYAVDRVTGIATPVGSKGLQHAVNYLMKWREKRAEAAGGATPVAQPPNQALHLTRAAILVSHHTKALQAAPAVELNRYVEENPNGDSMNKREIGSMTAKGGFINETDICEKFLNYKNDNDSKFWLEIMGYIPQKIQKIFATQIPIRIDIEKALELGISQDKYEETIRYKKADIQVRVEIIIDNLLHIENISLKKANRSAGFNQADKRPVKTYKQMWNFDDNTMKWLRVFTGDILPSDFLNHAELTKIKDKRRLFLNEIPQKELDNIIFFFSTNKLLVVTDILRGRGGLSAEWFLVTQKETDNSLSWILKDINTVCNFYAQGNVVASPRGSLKIGRVTMQRKGGTPDPTSLQFKINPLELFDE